MIDTTAASDELRVGEQIVQATIPERVGIKRLAQGRVGEVWGVICLIVRQRDRLSVVLIERA